MSKKLIVIILCLLFLLPVTSQAAEKAEYPLKQVLILSRHNIRAPLAGRDSTLAKLTPHTWFDWQCAPGELSPRGAELELLMGQYFRQWLEQESLLTHNVSPAAEEVRFYTNSFQRTIATARYFACGLLPLSDVTIEYHQEVNAADPVFLPATPDNELYRQQVQREFDQSGIKNDLQQRGERACKLLIEALDFDKSAYARKHGPIDYTGKAITLPKNGGLGLKTPWGALIPASDALTLQYYEEENDLAAAFGHQLTSKDWEDIAALKELGINSLFYEPTAAKALAAPLLATISQELDNGQRKITFLGGHDVNLAEVLPALGVEDYTLAGSIEAKTPIGAKLVIEKRQGKDGEEYAGLSLVYATAQQLRHRTPLTLQAPPARVPLRLKGLTANADGLYHFPDLQQRIQSAVQEGQRWQNVASNLSQSDVQRHHHGKARRKG
ncbi:glucose-1-phosphatase [Selenomonas sp. GACV-9]|uniref:histidine-type phosphatase n=1 Tax=Selenomonas sp. GACV-9 TaxID=3158782 RepID=UPI0008E920D6|nr:glucose-1-phosphatase [Selenomonas ruminantium]